MGTQKQKNIAKTVVKNSTLNKPLNGGEILESSGYSKSMTTNPKVVLESEGVKQELAILGFDEDTAMTVVSTILNNKKEKATDRLKASDQMFKVLGTYAPEKKLNLNANVTINKDHEDIAKKYEEDLRDNLTK